MVTCFDSSFSGKEINLRYYEKDVRCCFDIIIIRNEKVKFRVDNRLFQYIVPLKSRNWFETLFHGQDIDRNDRIYSGAISLVDFAFKKLNEKREMIDLKVLNKFLENS